MHSSPEEGEGVLEKNPIFKFYLKYILIVKMDK